MPALVVLMEEILNHILVLWQCFKCLEVSLELHSVSITWSRAAVTLSFCLRSMSAVSIARRCINEYNLGMPIRTLHRATPAVDVHGIDRAASK